MREAIEIVIGAAVAGDEGFVGEVERIELDPSGRFVVRVVIEPRHEGGTARLVPAEEVRTGPDGLVLNRTLETFEEFPVADGQGS